MHPGQNAVGQGKVGSAQHIDHPAQPLDDLPFGPPGGQGHRGNRDRRDRDGLNRHDRNQNLLPDRPAHGTSQSAAKGVCRPVFAVSDASHSGYSSSDPFAGTNMLQLCYNFEGFLR